MTEELEELDYSQVSELIENGVSIDWGKLSDKITVRQRGALAVIERKAKQEARERERLQPKSHQSIMQQTGVSRVKPSSRLTQDSIAMFRALDAIKLMDSIPADDPQRIPALQRILDWIVENA